MTWGGVAIGVGSIAAAGIGAMSSGGKKGKFSMPKPPPFYEDEYYKKTQDKLYDFGSNMMEGNVPDYYKPLGEVGGKEFDGMLALNNRDVAIASTEDYVRRGMGRSGVASAGMAKAISDSSTKLRWADFLRAMSGREIIMNAGVNTVSGVRSAGLDFQQQKNNWGLASVGLQASNAIAQQNQQNLQSNAQGNFFGSLADAGLSMFGDYLGGKYKPTATPTTSSKVTSGSAAPGKLLQYEYPY